MKIKERPAQDHKLESLKKLAPEGVDVFSGLRVYTCHQCQAPFLLTNECKDFSEDKLQVYSDIATETNLSFWYITEPAGEEEFRIIRLVPKAETIVCDSWDEVTHCLKELLWSQPEHKHWLDLLPPEERSRMLELSASIPPSVHLNGNASERDH